jgi:hypothetical protein
MPTTTTKEAKREKKDSSQSGFKPAEPCLYEGSRKSIRMLLVSLVAHLFRFVTVLIINCSMAEKH